MNAFDPPKSEQKDRKQSFFAGWWLGLCVGVVVGIGLAVLVAVATG